MGAIAHGDARCGSLSLAVGTVACVNNRSHRLLGEIEAGALDQKTPIGDLLRRVMRALGGQAGSTEMRDWASRELRGYGPGDELPEYRKIAAPLQLDMAHAAYILRGQTISPWELPEIAQDTITNIVDLRSGIAEIEQLAQRCEPGNAVKLAPPGSQELVVLMTVLIAEVRATMPEGAVVPPAEVATKAINFAVSGKRNKINFAAPQVANEVKPPEKEEKPSHWVRIAAAVVVGVLTIAGVFFAIMQAQGWRF
jgi:hypothetical protein